MLRECGWKCKGKIDENGGIERSKEREKANKKIRVGHWLPLNGN